MPGNVLWLTHHWPPLMSTCANMAHAFADHLALLGVKVYVVTPRIKEAAIPEVAPGVAMALTAGKGKASFWRKATALTKGDAQWFAPALSTCESLLAERLKPGEHWAVIGSSGAKTVCFEVAALVARRHGLPLVLDYRDPWTLNEAVKLSEWKYLKKAPKLWLAKQRERRTLAAADWVLVRSQGMKQSMAAAFGEGLNRKMVVVPNAVDDRLLAAVMERPHPDPAVDDGHAPLKVLFKGRGSGREGALSTIQEALLRLDRPVQWTLIGMGRHLIRNQGKLSIEYHDGLPQADLIAALMQQDVLLTAVPAEEKGRETGTIWLYVATGKPLVALAPPDGDEAAATRLSPVHAVLPPDAAPEQVTAALLSVAGRETTPSAPPQALASTHMRTLLNRLNQSWSKRG